MIHHYATSPAFSSNFRVHFFTKLCLEVKEAVTTCFALQAESFYVEGIQTLLQRYDKCLNNDGNYVEK